MTAIWGTDPNGRWLQLAPTAYLAEAELHYLVGTAPQMLPLAGTPQLTVLGREVRLGSGYADLLAVESTGRLVVIGVKLSTNAESRRAVVAQVLSYAGYLQGLDLAQLESQNLREHLGRRRLGTPCRPGRRAPGGRGPGGVSRRDLPQPCRRRLPLGHSLGLCAGRTYPGHRLSADGDRQDRHRPGNRDRLRGEGLAGTRATADRAARRTKEMSDAAVNARQSGTQKDGSRDFRSAIDQAAPEFRDDLARLTDWAESLEAEGLARLATRKETQEAPA